MLITLEKLNKIVPNPNHRTELFIDPLNAAMTRYEINTPLRIAAFIAQIAHESGSFRYVEELASGKKYSSRADLGNTDPLAVETAKPFATGPFYKGRGLIQITGYFNYRDCGQDIHIDLVHHPALLSEPNLAALSAGWFWNKNKLNVLADKRDFEKITRIINGGLNGYQDRLNFYHRALMYV